ncbi:MAG TPA: hypothetical protein VF385_02860, partial [Patescibacteria group bacterium]
EIVQNATVICPKCLKHGENIVGVGLDRPVDDLKSPEPVSKEVNKVTDVEPQTTTDKKSL